MYQLRREFTLPEAVRTATAWATAHGIYELFVNGSRVGDHELTPGFTAYRRTAAGAALRRRGPAARRAPTPSRSLLRDGWFRGRHGFERHADGFGDRVAALLALDVDGTVVATGAGWRSRPAGCAADLMDGQRSGASGPRGRTRHPVHGGLYDDRDAARPRRRAAGAPGRELAPVAVTGSRRTTVVDFGQNINGWVRLARPRSRRHDLTLAHGEHLGGRRSRRHRPPARLRLRAPKQLLPAGQVDTVVSPGAPARCSSRGTPPTASATCRSTGARDRCRGRHRASSCTPTSPRPAGSGAATTASTRLHERCGVELPRQRLRRPHRLPAAGTLRLHRRLAGLRRHRRLHLRRRRVQRQVAARPRRRPVARRPDPDHLPNPAGAGPSGSAFADAIGRARPGGATPR